jgi:prepilin-type N-terminal cleavage/methylation domain-containing protein
MLRSRTHAGFTLVEVLVATALLVTIAAGSAQLFAIAIRHNVAARQQLAMSLAASRKIDEIAESVARNRVPAAPMGALDRAVGGFSDVTIECGATLERRWLIAPVTSYSATAVVIVTRIVAVGSRAAPDLEVATIREGAP